jgi:hypothetical protein
MGFPSHSKVKQGFDKLSPNGTGNRPMFCHPSLRAGRGEAQPRSPALGGAATRQ